MSPLRPLNPKATRTLMQANIITARKIVCSLREPRIRVSHAEQTVEACGYVSRQKQGIVFVLESAAAPRDRNQVLWLLATVANEVANGLCISRRHCHIYLIDQSFIIIF